MLGLGFTEFVFLFFLALLLFGPKELPKLARLIARCIYEMKNLFQRLEKEWHLFEDQKTETTKSKPDQYKS
ncbi:MAG: twin-arginine translocase TatA/TatE family subunit [Oligoflexia bacterium]|nr:twin-arginine translocase TatA/TatE family subunit [Bdellovibrionales bacterium]MYE07299.1 twin-arginine translocase TatA/TatE family subunit [Oligoflexia bacterium]